MKNRYQTMLELLPNAQSIVQYGLFLEAFPELNPLKTTPQDA